MRLPASLPLLQHPLLRQIISFGLVGVAGFVVDTATLYLALALGVGPYAGRVVSYLVAASSTWLLNRSFTFRARRSANWPREWLHFLLANSFGGLLNYSVYAALVTYSPTVHAEPVLGVAAGSLAGMTVNFVLSRFVVFRGGN